MPAAAPAEQHNPERYGGSNAIRRHDWRRGTQDCALHPDAPSASGADHWVRPAPYFKLSPPSNARIWPVTKFEALRK